MPELPPGLSPVSFGPRALARLDARKTKPQSWYLDVTMLRKYYLGGGGGGRMYHHTAPINMTYALHEALTIVLEEGLDARVARHGEMHRRLRVGLEALGLSYIPKQSLFTLNCIAIPQGADDAAVRRRLLEEYGIEIGAGLGPMAGKAWRIGLMGHGADGAQRGPCSGCSPPAPWVSINMAADALAPLAALLPPDRLLCNPAQLGAYESDGLTAFHARPLAVALPESQDEVIAIVRACRDASGCPSSRAEAARVCQAVRCRSPAESSSR